MILHIYNDKIIARNILHDSASHSIRVNVESFKFVCRIFLRKLTSN